jgi:hypothetical protein
MRTTFSRPPFSFRTVCERSGSPQNSGSFDWFSSSWMRPSLPSTSKMPPERVDARPDLLADVGDVALEEGIDLGDHFVGHGGLLRREAG